MPSGRPSLYGTAASVRLELRVTPNQHREPQRAAEERGESVSSLVRELIDERVEDDRPFPCRRDQPFVKEKVRS
jgi:hypothetical protein